MISLLLTLFISMLSLGSPIYRLEENSESRISTISNESLILNDSKPVENLGHSENDNRVFFCVNDMTTYQFLDTITNVWVNRYSIPAEHQAILPTNGYSVQETQTFVNFNGSIPYGADMYFCYGTNGNVTINQRLTRITIDKGNNGTAIVYHIYFYTYVDDANRYSYFGELYFELYLNVSFDGETFFNTYDAGTSGTSGAYICNASTNISGNYILTDSLNAEFPYRFIYDCYTLFNNKYNGYDAGYRDGEKAGYNKGYQYGYDDALSSTDYDTTALTIFSGIMGIALVPINMFLQIFNFEILGINLSGFISGILTVAVVVIIIRMVTGGKKDD